MLEKSNSEKIAIKKISLNEKNILKLQLSESCIYSGNKILPS